MTDDLVKRLRQWDCGESTWGLLESAADRIEKLVEENGALFAANVRLNSRADLDSDGYVDRIEKLEDELHHCFHRINELQAALRDIIEMDPLRPAFNCQSIARKALEGKDD